MQLWPEENDVGKKIGHWSICKTSNANTIHTWKMEENYIPTANRIHSSSTPVRECFFFLFTKTAFKIYRRLKDRISSHFNWFTTYVYTKPKCMVTFVIVTIVVCVCLRAFLVSRSLFWLWQFSLSMVEFVHQRSTLITFVRYVQRKPLLPLVSIRAACCCCDWPQFFIFSVWAYPWPTTYTLCMPL